MSEQLAAVKFCFLLQKNVAGTVVMLKSASKDDVLGKPQIQLQKMTKMSVRFVH